MSKFSLTHLLKPSSAKESSPLLLLLHGYGANEYDLIGLADELDSRFTVVSARAPIALGNENYAWFPIAFTDQGIRVLDTNTAHSSKELIFTFLDELISAYSINSNNIYLMGFSQGSVMAYSVALTEPEKIRGLVAMSGRLPDERFITLAPIERLSKLQIFISHGVYDEILPIQNGRESEKRLVELGLNPNYKEYPMAHQISSECLKDINHWLTEQLNS